MTFDENWAIAPSRITAFFRQQPDVAETPDGFRFGDCRIVLEPLPSSGNGIWDIPRTRVWMEGPEEDTKEIHSRFFLRFLSAGG